MQRHTEITVRRQAAGQSAFDKSGPRIRLQLLQADGHFELPDPQLQFGAVAIIDIGLEDLHRAAAKLRHKLQIKIPENGALKNGPRPTQTKAVIGFVAAISEKSAGIDLEKPAQLNDVGSIG